MTPTQNYSAVHSSLKETARSFSLVPMDVRVLLALGDRGGSAPSALLVKDLCCDGGAVRRSLLALRRQGMVQGGGKPGARLPIEVIGSGVAVINEARSYIDKQTLSHAPETDQDKAGQGPARHGEA